MGVPVSWATDSRAESASTAITKSPPERLRRMRVSLNVFGDHAHPVVDHLKKSATYGEATYGLFPADRQRTLAEQQHERCGVRQNADLSVESWRNDRVSLSVEHRGLGGDHRDLHHPLASCLARAITSSIPPCM